MNNIMKYSIVLVGIISIILFFILKTESTNNYFLVYILLVLIWLHSLYSQLRFNQLNDVIIDTNKSLKLFFEQNKNYNQNLESINNSLVNSLGQLLERLKQLSIEESCNKTIETMTNFSNDYSKSFEDLRSFLDEYEKKNEYFIKGVNKQINELNNYVNEFSKQSFTNFENLKENSNSLIKELKEQIEKFQKSNECFINTNLESLKVYLEQNASTISSEISKSIGNLNQNIEPDGILEAILNNKVEELSSNINTYTENIKDENKEIINKIEDMIIKFNEIEGLLKENYKENIELVKQNIKLHSNLSKEDEKVLKDLMKKLDK